MNNTRQKVPIWEKPLLTIEEAADYFNIGKNKLYQLADNEEFALLNGNKRLVKRKNLEKYLISEYSI